MKNSKFIENVLRFIYQKGLEIFLEGTINISDVVNCILKILDSNIHENHYTFTLKAINLSSMILSVLVKHEDIQTDFNLIDRLLSKLGIFFNFN